MTRIGIGGSSGLPAPAEIGRVDSEKKDAYVPPTGDHEPLDEIELAFVRALVPILVDRILEEADGKKRRAATVPDAEGA